MGQLTCSSGNCFSVYSVDVVTKFSKLCKNSGSRKDIALAKSFAAIASATALVYMGASIEHICAELYMKSYHCDSFHERHASDLVFTDSDHVRRGVRGSLE